MARIIEEIAVLIGADTRGLDKGMKKAKKDVNVLTRSFKRLGSTIIAAFGARALFNTFKRTLANTNALIKTAKGVGFLATEYQTLIFALDQVGVKASSARIALGDFQKRLGKAIAGTSPQFAKAFRDAGLDPEALSKLRPADAFDIALKRLADLRDDPRIAGLTGAVFEEQSGKDVLQVIRQWEKYLAAREKFAKRVGGLTKNQQDNIEELSEELRVYKAQWEVLKATIIADAAPAIMDALNDLEEAGAFEAMADAVGRLVDEIHVLVGDLKWLGETIAKIPVPDWLVELSKSGVSKTSPFGLTKLPLEVLRNVRGFSDKMDKSPVTLKGTPSKLPMSAITGEMADVKTGTGTTINQTNNFMIDQAQNAKIEKAWRKLNEQHKRAGVGQ
jgi:TP901 family phage tail tape measure protein